MMSQDMYNTTNEDAVSNLSTLSTSTMKSSLYFHEKPDQFVQQAKLMCWSHTKILWREKLLGSLLINKVLVFVYVHSCACTYVCVLLFALYMDAWIYVNK